jgi:pilus assembly protein Flp/PilA
LGLPRQESSTEQRGQKVTKFISLLKDDSGAAAAEYALILAIVGAAIAVAAIGLGGAVSNAMNSSSKCISTKGVTCT